MDEPAAGLPESEVPEFAAVVRSVRDDHGAGVLLIDHNMALIMDVCDRIQVLDQGRTLAAGCADGSVRLWEVNRNGPPRERATWDGHGGAVWSLAFSPDGSLLASGGDDGVVRLWAAAEPSEAAHELGRHSGTVIDVEFSHDGGRLVTVGHGEPAEVRVWDAVRGGEP